MKDQLNEVESNLEARMKKLGMEVVKDVSPSKSSTLQAGLKKSSSISSDKYGSCNITDTTSYPKLSIVDGIPMLGTSTQLLNKSASSLSNENVIRPSAKQVSSRSIGAISVESFHSSVSSHSESSRRSLTIDYS